MYSNGFIKVAAITPVLEVGNPSFNVCEMLKLLDNLDSSFAVFPELGVTGYTCNDLFYQPELLDDSNKAINYFLANNKFEGIVMIGAPILAYGSLYNCALVIQKNKILGIVPKRSLPNSHEYYEKRWFKSGATSFYKEIYFNEELVPFGDILFEDPKHKIIFGVEICEDMWAPVTPSNLLSYYGANIIFNLSGSNETLGKAKIRKSTVLENSRRNCGAYVYVSAGVNESTSETVFSGHNIIALCGELLVETKNFCMNSEVITSTLDMSKINYKRIMNTNLHDDIGLSMDYTHVLFELEEKEFEFTEAIDSTPFVPKDNAYEDFLTISSLQEYALLKRIKHTNAKSLVIGVSGGLDSTLALLIAVETYKKLNKPLSEIIAVTMPGLATSSRTKSNATKMMEALGVTVLEKPIKEECDIHFKTIGQDPELHDVTYENTQARIRTMILMNLANKNNGLVLGTGDMSELALGWCTYNGDQMSMYGINAGIPKTLVRFMIEYYAKYKFTSIKDILLDIVDTPISPELSSTDQKTEDFIGKYEVNDFILYRFLSCGDTKDRIKFLVTKAFNYSNEAATKAVDNFFKRFYQQQFKRQALPDGPKILDISLSPRSDFRMPSDVSRK